jgi:hypothetical protein
MLGEGSVVDKYIITGEGFAVIVWERKLLIVFFIGSTINWLLIPNEFSNKLQTPVITVIITGIIILFLNSSIILFLLSLYIHIFKTTIYS